MVLGSGGSLDQGTPTAPSLEDTTETATFQQVPQQLGVPESTCAASGFQEFNSGRFSSEVAERIKAPQRESSRKVYESRWTTDGQWCSQNKGDITSATVPQVTEFLKYLFTVKNLKQATITGYGTAFYCIKTYLHNPNKCLCDLPFGQGHRQCVSPFFFTENTHVNPSGHLLEVISPL